MLSGMNIDPRRVPVRNSQIGLLAWLGLTGTTNLFARTRHDLSPLKWIDREWVPKAASAGRRTANRLPNGDRPHSSGLPSLSGWDRGWSKGRGLATNEVIATSRDHAKLRVEKHHCQV